MSRTGVLEVAAVVATGILHLAASEALDAQGIFVAAALLGWVGWAAWRARRDPRVLATWGLRRANLGPTTLAVTVFAAFAVGAMAWIGASRGTLRLPPHLLALLLLYPVWGLVQQLLVQGLVARNMAVANWPQLVIVLVCAALFGLVHVPSLELCLATFGIGLVFTPVFLRWRNIWPLGVGHGWLGAFFYVWVLGRNPWQDVLA